MRQQGSGLGGNKPINTGAQVLENEILLGWCLALVDFLRPLFKRQLDAKSLVDGKGNIKKGQRIDAKIINGVTFRRDFFTRDVTGLGNDTGNCFERGGHRQRLRLVAGGKCHPRKT